MDIVTLGAALNGSAEYVNSHFKGGSNIQIVDNPDGTQTINASGKVSSEDTVARADIAAIKDGETLDSFGDVETALATKANTATTYTKTEVDTALDNKVDKVSGKGLSTNDYTTAEKTKLAGIAEGAEANEIEGIKVNSSTVNPDANKVVNITVPTTAADVSALPDTTKYAAALSLTINSSTFVMTGQLKDQNGDNLGTAQTIDLPLESVVVDGSYNSQTKKVVLTLQNGNTIEFSIADLVSGLQTELSATNKLNPAYIEYDSLHRAVSDAEKSAWNAKQNALTTEQLAAVNSGITSTDVAQITTNKNNILWNTQNGVKNIAKPNTISATSGITVVQNLGHYEISGTTGGSQYTVYLCTPTEDIITTEALYIPAATTRTNVKYMCHWKNTQDASQYSIIGTGLTIPQGCKIHAIYIQVAANTTFSLNVDMMICKKAIYDADPSYQPYAMTNAELTAKAAIEDISDKIIATSGYTVNSLTKLYKQNNRIFGQVIISKDTGSFSIAEETIAEFSSGYCPKDIQIQSCFFGASIYNIENIGYTYIQRATAVSGAGSVIVKAYQSVGTVVNIHVDFVI